MNANNFCFFFSFSWHSVNSYIGLVVYFWPQCCAEKNAYSCNCDCTTHCQRESKPTELSKHTFKWKCLQLDLFCLYVDIHLICAWQCEMFLCLQCFVVNTQVSCHLNRELKLLVRMWKISQFILFIINFIQSVVHSYSFTVQWIVNLLHYVGYMLETNNYVRCLTIDFSKAFDVVNHSVLLGKVYLLWSYPIVYITGLFLFLLGVGRYVLLTGCGHLSYLFLVALFKDQVLGLPSTLF